MKLYESLENYFRKKKLEEKEIMKIPLNFELDLNELDYQKYKDTKPQEAYSFTWWLFKAFCSLIVSVFILYAISDFMNYSIITTLIKDLIPLLGECLIIILVATLTLDLMYFFIYIGKINKHKLFFYKRLKKYEKN